MNRLRGFLILILLICCFAVPAQGAVELSWNGQSPRTIEEVYIHDGVPYLALDDILGALGMQGHWSSLDHLYRFNTPQGKASLFPGGQYLRFGERFLPLDHPPRFLDGRLRVAEDFVLVQIPLVTGRTVYYRNLKPPVAVADTGDNPIDRLFAFLLQKKRDRGPALRGVAIDVAHGGTDAGSIGPRGNKEKDVVLQVARQLEKLIKMELGIPVYLSRDADYTLTLQQRLETAAKPEVDAFLLLHAQGYASPEASGARLFVRPNDAAGVKGSGGDDRDSMRLALSCQQSLTKAGISVGQVYQAPLLPLGRGDLPTLLVEMGYLTSDQDRERLTSAEGQRQIAAALLEGLKAFAEERKRAEQ